MPLVIGTDEAGYGPNLGPLVVAASAWKCSKLDELTVDSLSDESAAAISLEIADSKQLYQSGQGLGRLERNLLAAARITGHSFALWREAWQALAGHSGEALQELAPWHRDFNPPLPCAATDEEIGSLADPAQRMLAGKRRLLRALAARAVFPGEFNAELRVRGNKAHVLSVVTLALAREMLEKFPDRPAVVICDKHGGRDRYMALLQHTFPDELIRIVCEGSEESRYRFGPPRREIEFVFRPRSERWLPAALASMTAKYLRELAMQAFNNFWCREVPGLAPTAGYPTDARRFRLAIAERQVALGISDEVLWRER